MNIVKHKNGRFSITMTCDEAENVCSCVRLDWASDDSSLVYDAVRYGRIGFSDYSEKELEADIREHLYHSLDAIRNEGMAQEDQKEVLAEAYDVAFERDSDDLFCITVEKSPDADRPFNVALRKAKDRLEKRMVARRMKAAA